MKYPEIYCNLLIQIVALAGLGAMNLHRSLEARICFRSGIFYILSRCKVLGDEISKIGYQECNTERAIAMTTLTWERAELIFTLRTIGEVIENTKDTELQRDLLEIWEQIKDQAVKLWKQEAMSDE